MADFVALQEGSLDAEGGPEAETAIGLRVELATLLFAKAHIYTVV